ncbi:MAG: hypothetical protein ABII72_02125 [Parcubacteria group bacterium]
MLLAAIFTKLAVFAALIADVVLVVLLAKFVIRFVKSLRDLKGTKDYYLEAGRGLIKSLVTAAIVIPVLYGSAMWVICDLPLKRSAGFSAALQYTAVCYAAETAEGTAAMFFEPPAVWKKINRKFCGPRMEIRPNHIRPLLFPGETASFLICIQGTTFADETEVNIEIYDPTKEEPQQRTVKVKQGFTYTTTLSKSGFYLFGFNCEGCANEEFHLIGVETLEREVKKVVLTEPQLTLGRINPEDIPHLFWPMINFMAPQDVMAWNDDRFPNQRKLAIYGRKLMRRAVPLMREAWLKGRKSKQYGTRSVPVQPAFDYASLLIPRAEAAGSDDDEASGDTLEGLKTWVAEFVRDYTLSEAELKMMETYALSKGASPEEVDKAWKKQWGNESGLIETNKRMGDKSAEVAIVVIEATTKTAENPMVGVMGLLCLGGVVASPFTGGSSVVMVSETVCPLAAGLIASEFRWGVAQKSAKKVAGEEAEQVLVGVEAVCSLGRAVKTLSNYNPGKTFITYKTETPSGRLWAAKQLGLVNDLTSGTSGAVNYINWHSSRYPLAENQTALNISVSTSSNTQNDSWRIANYTILPPYTHKIVPPLPPLPSFKTD